MKKRRDGLMWGVGVVLVVYTTSYLLVLLVCILSVNHSHSFIIFNLGGSSTQHFLGLYDLGLVW